MSQAPFEIYPKQLSLKKNGYALWRPDPRNEPAVEIGDVGYVERGKFIRLFNASKPLGDESNQLGVPDNYYPLQIGKITEDTMCADFPIMSENVTQLGAELEISGGGAGLGFSFKCSKEQGAVLVLRGDADVQDALHKREFLRYIRENYKTWLLFANNHERLITLNDLILITGCDKTSAWACAVFSGCSEGIGLKFLAGQAGIVQGSAGLWASWEKHQSIQAHSGPRLARPVEGFQQSTGPNHDLKISDVTAGESLLVRVYMLLVLMLHHTLYRAFLFPLSFYEQDQTTADPSSGRVDPESAPDSPTRQSIGTDFAWGQGDTANLENAARKLLATDELSPRNQCIFLRGFKLMDRKTWGQKLRLRKQDYDGFDYFDRKGGSDTSGGKPGPSGPRDPPSSHGSSGQYNSFRREYIGNSGEHSGQSGGYSGREGSGGLGASARSWTGNREERHESSSTIRLTSETSDGETLEDSDPSMQLNYDKEPTALDVILEYILENSSAELAVVHDDDLSNLNPAAEVLENFDVWIHEAAPKIYIVEDHVGMLESTYRVSTSLTESVRLNLQRSSDVQEDGGFSTAPFDESAVLSASGSAVQVLIPTDEKENEEQGSQRDHSIHSYNPGVLHHDQLTFHRSLCINDKSGYRIYSAANIAKGLPVVVKTYTGARAKERWALDIALNSRLRDSGLLQLTEVSMQSSYQAFLVFDGDYHAQVQESIAGFLSTDSVRGIDLAFRTISAISLGLSYLSSQDVLSSIGIENYDILVDLNDNVQITFSSTLPGEHEEQGDVPRNVSEWNIFNKLSLKTFTAVNQYVHAREWVIEWKSLEWKSLERSPSTLECIPRDFLAQLIVSSFTTSQESPSYPQVQVGDRLMTHNSCGGPVREDIVLTTDIFSRTTPSHSTPRLRHICSVCETLFEKQVSKPGKDGHGERSLSRESETNTDRDGEDSATPHNLEYQNAGVHSHENHASTVIENEISSGGDHRRHDSQGVSKRGTHREHLGLFRCYSCQLQITLERRHETADRRTLCNSCGLLYNKFGGNPASGEIGYLSHHLQSVSAGEASDRLVRDTASSNVTVPNSGTRDLSFSPADGLLFLCFSLCRAGNSVLDF